MQNSRDSQHVIFMTVLCDQTQPAYDAHHTMQMDFLEHQAVKDVIIMSVVLEEVKHRNQSIYQRLRTLCASDTKRFFVFANENHR